MKRQAELTALKVAFEKKDEEIHQLDWSLSQMSIDKDQISTKLAQIEDDLVQANRELQVYKEKVCDFCVLILNVHKLGNQVMK